MIICVCRNLNERDIDTLIDTYHVVRVRDLLTRLHPLRQGEECKKCYPYIAARLKIHTPPERT